MTRWETLWSFKTKTFRVTWDVAPETDIDLSWDDTSEVAEKLSAGTYQCFMSRIVVYFHGAEIACDYLGQSIYERPIEFRDHVGSRGKYGSYFVDMVRSAIAEARTYLAEAQTVRVRTV